MSSRITHKIATMLVVALLLVTALLLAARPTRAEERPRKVAGPAIVDCVVQENRNSYWQELVDYPQGVDVPYSVVATLPADLENYPSLPYWIVMRMADGVDYLEGTAQVFVRHEDGTQDDVTSLLDVGYDGGRREVWAGSRDIVAAIASIEHTDEIVLLFNARLNDDAVTGFEEGNVSWAHLEYGGSVTVGDEAASRTGVSALVSARAALFASGLVAQASVTDLPYLEVPHQRSVEMPASVYSYNLRIKKVDADTGEPLEGAKFSLRNELGMWYVRGKDWESDQDQATVYTTDSKGLATFPYVDSEYYEVVEVEPPAGYVQADPVDVRISTDVPEDQSTTYVDAVSKAATSVTADAATGMVDLVIQNAVDPTKPRLNAPHPDSRETRRHLTRTPLSRTADVSAPAWLVFGISVLALLGAAAVRRAPGNRNVRWQLAGSMPANTGEGRKHGTW